MQLRVIHVLALVAIWLLSFQPVRAQVTGKVRDSESGDPVPYANIQVLDKNSGTSSDEQGYFTLADTDTPATLVISATGYEPLQTVYRSNQTVALRKARVQLQEVVISNRHKDSILKIGTYKKSDIRIDFAVNKVPWILVRYFPYDAAYKRTPFLKSVMVQTNSKVKDAVFNLKLYRKGEDGLPGAFLYSENIIVHAKKGVRNTKVDLTPYNIIFPEEGFFVGIEFMLVAQNQYTVDAVDYGETRSYKKINYAPGIGALPADTGDNAMIFLKGKWDRGARNTEALLPKAYKNKYNLFAVELTLSD